MDETAAHVAVGVGVGLVEVGGEGVFEVAEDVFPGREVDGEVVPFAGGDLGDAPIEEGFAGGDDLDHGGVAVVEVALDALEQGGAFHAVEQMGEEALLGGLEGGARGRLGLTVESGALVGDVGDLERVFEIGMDDGESVGVGVVDLALRLGEGVLEDFNFDAVVAQYSRAIQAEGLEVARDQLHCGDAAGVHRGDEVGAGIERGVLIAPQTEARGVGEGFDGAGAGGRNVEDARVGERVLQAHRGETLLGWGVEPARAVGRDGVGEGVGFVEDDEAVVGGAIFGVEGAGEPGDDLVKAGGLVAPGR